VGLLERDFRQRSGSVTSPREGQTAPRLASDIATAAAAAAAAAADAPVGALRAEHLQQRAGERAGNRHGRITLHDDPGWFLLLVLGGDSGGSREPPHQHCRGWRVLLVRRFYRHPSATAGTPRETR